MITLQAEQGHAPIDSIATQLNILKSSEAMLAYARSWSSPADLSTAAFPMLAALEKSFAGSDSARGGGPVNQKPASGIAPRISVPSQAVGVSPQVSLLVDSAVKLWHHQWYRPAPLRGDACPPSVANVNRKHFSVAQNNQDQLMPCSLCIQTGHGQPHLIDLNAIGRKQVHRWLPEHQGICAGCRPFS